MNQKHQISSLFNTYPRLHDLAQKAKSKIPHVSWQYLEAGTGQEDALQRNIKAFQKDTLTPRVCKGSLDPKLETTLL